MGHHIELQPAAMNDSTALFASWRVLLPADSPWEKEGTYSLELLLYLIFFPNLNLFLETSCILKLNICFVVADDTCILLLIVLCVLDEFIQP